MTEYVVERGTAEGRRVWVVTRDGRIVGSARTRRKADDLVATLIAIDDQTKRIGK